MIIVLTTVSNEQEARQLAEKIVTKRLAGCVQILPEITSVYEWEGSVVAEKEFLLLCKTSRSKWEAIRAFVEAEHNYSVPEIVSLNTEQVSEKYDKWLSSVIET